jgi:thiol:disulfide interchange protein
MLNHVWKQRQHTVLAILLITAVASPNAFAEKEIQWEKSIEKGLAKAQKTGKPVMMDFYTDW